ncbi:PhzF family phenazine biosynthesis protein [Marinobacter xestospongiae]|uniref:PhzF family phenazine biosynthesis protein n=1 Tax=Marinobacter xestospongiae TaxID=994319 RepID=A0ABU3W0N3_9GAMM|nr:PhzF family phenazine biosynthesis protein [Marinobacter xestospongiae]MDV2080093.1 PhzF family phenazine biosynthesis protein [Marinobacter xestospongiae]
MKKVDVFLVNAFSANGAGGNAAGVVLHADNLSNEEKLQIAQAVGYSETAFVVEEDEADFALSFFTVTGEVDFCGHATLAAFSTMYREGVVTEGEYVQRTKAGLLAVTVGANGHVVMAQKLPECLGVFEYEAVSGLIGVDAAALASTQLPVEVISTGLPDMIVPVPQGYLDRLKVNERLLSDFCKDHGVVSLHAFELFEESGSVTASCRNFAPLFGIPEESATGSASGALACYLSRYLNGGRSGCFTFEQGRAMNCTSLISASVDYNGSDVAKVRVGGFSEQIGRQRLSV